MRLKQFKYVQELVNYPDYGVDTEGNVWSFKRNRITKLSPFNKLKYKAIVLTDIKGKPKHFYVHRLVALCFMNENNENSYYYLRHLNDDFRDNRIENLNWIKTKGKIRPRRKRDPETYKKYVQERKAGLELNDDLKNKLQNVYHASIQKGLRMKDMNTFMNEFIDERLNEYINQYGLRKIM